MIHNDLPPSPFSCFDRDNRKMIETLSLVYRDTHFLYFTGKKGRVINKRDGSGKSAEITASWLEEEDNGAGKLKEGRM